MEHVDALVEALASIRNMALQTEMALQCNDPSDMESRVQNAVRFGEQARGLIEETLDSAQDERIMLNAERALVALEDALDEANQAIYASESAMQEHVEAMAVHLDNTQSQISAATGLQAA